MRRSKNMLKSKSKQNYGKKKKKILRRINKKQKKIFQTKNKRSKIEQKEYDQKIT